ncbi:hypothetical protein [Gloeobacter violaceus]|uniref:Gll3358 protein n=1 Tax=Gloeobacter violaceus (strain ATCC 29082 / PCC 7421) TaxID=251221 RepID=Q7NG16_GLOVI|nr:hypothetical protein [Gloeobacter violaceus]BAC91299.1 gll3358 [Gloeobacter violaceus PCC 7421]
MENSADRPDAGRGLCGLKIRGFVEIIERLLDKEAPQPDGEGRRVYEGKPYRVEKGQDQLKVWSQGRLVLELAGDELRTSHLTPRDLLEIGRIEARLKREQ